MVSRSEGEIPPQQSAPSDATLANRGFGELSHGSGPGDPCADGYPSPAFMLDPSHARRPVTASLVCELCRLFYQLGWASGTGGGISIRDEHGVWMAPSGVQKERIDPADVF